MFLNLKEQVISESWNANYVIKDSCELKIGQYPDINFDSMQSFKDSTVNLDNIAVWDRALTEDEQNIIYFAELGKN